MLEVALFEHNQSAYDAAVEMMKQTGKAAIIHPTGTGKSFIGFRLCADQMTETSSASHLTDTANKRVLWLSPSEYIFKTQLENLKAATSGEIPRNIVFCTYAKLMWMSEAEMANICADGASEISSESNQPVPSSQLAQSDQLVQSDQPAQSEQPAPSSQLAQSDQLALSAQPAPSNQPGQAEKGKKAAAPSYIILDEFHRCGAQQWGQGVRKLLSVFPDTPILGLSATNIRYLDNQRDMADELFDGNIASEMTLGEAIVRGILNPPKYVLSVYSCQQSLAKYEQRVKSTKSRIVRETCEKYLEDLKRALEMSEGLDEIFDKHMPDRTGKYIVFCSSKEHMDEMMGHLEWFAKVDPHPHVYSLYTLEPGAEQAFDDFRADNDTSHLRLLYCIDALNEGIHVEDISGVILLRPTISPIIYKQQIGRALSASKKNDAVVFDIVQNLNCLESWSSIEDEMQLVASYYRDLGEGSHIVNEHFRIIDEVRDCRELFNRLNETLSASWDMMFGLAETYYREYGDLEVPAYYSTEDGYRLGSWIVTQRRVRKGEVRGSLTEERIRKLDSIGMEWNSFQDRLWEKNYSAAKAYYETHGDLNVKSDYVTENGVKLGCWLGSIRTCEKAGIRQKYLTPERIKMLDDLGMIWGKTDYFWERNYEAAAAYYREHGDLDVPSAYVDADGIKLGSWIYRLRKERKKHGETRIGKKLQTDRELQRDQRFQADAESQTARETLTEEQISRLDAIGMVWTKANDSKWEKGYQAAKEYAARHGDLLVPARYTVEDGYSLGRWICRQRLDYQSDKISAARKKKLEAIGMVWQADSWESRLELVKKWYRETGSLAISQNTVVDGVWIGKWLAFQRKALQDGKLSQRQAELLAELPADDPVKASARWKEMYQTAKEYAQAHGSLAGVPADYRGKSGTSLYNWILNQRHIRKTGKMSEEKIRLLDKIGFIWDAQAGRAC
ncbi:MAG: Helicase associated domain protein [Clostridiales bacterium]|nr:Helicase associated domain protein [Clostridiales bacterium]